MPKILPNDVGSAESILKENSSSPIDINSIADTSKSLSSILNGGHKVYTMRDELNEYKSKISEDLFKNQFNINDEYVASLYEYTMNIGGYDFKDIFIETTGEVGKTSVVILSTAQFNKDSVYASETEDDTPSDFIKPSINITEVFTYSNSTGKLVDYVRYSDN